MPACLHPSPFHFESLHFSSSHSSHLLLSWTPFVSRPYCFIKLSQNEQIVGLTGLYCVSCVPLPSLPNTILKHCNIIPSGYTRSPTCHPPSPPSQYHFVRQCPLETQQKGKPTKNDANYYSPKIRHTITANHPTNRGKPNGYQSRGLIRPVRINSGKNQGIGVTGVPSVGERRPQTQERKQMYPSLHK